MLTGAATVSTQAMVLDQERIVNFLQLDRRVAHVALADRNSGRLAVTLRASAPAAAEDVHEHIALTGLGALAVEGTAPHIALMGGRNSSG